MLPVEKRPRKPDRRQPRGRRRLTLLLVAIGGCAGTLAVIGDVFPQAPVALILLAGMAAGLLGAIGDQLIRMWQDRSGPADPLPPAPPPSNAEFISPVFVGRDEAVGQILRLFEPLVEGRSRGRARRGRRPSAAAGSGDQPPPLVIAMTGGPGMGKSELAAQIASRVKHHFPDGTQRYKLFGAPSVDARAPRRPEKILAELLRSIGHAPQRDDMSLETLRATWRSLTVDHRLLLILDDAKDFDQVEPLLPGGDRCAVLITSTNALANRRMYVDYHQVGPLSTEAGAELLAHPAGAGGAAPVSADGEALAEIAEQCGGRPLSLVLCRRVLQDGLSTDQLLTELRADGGENLFTDRSAATAFLLLLRDRTLNEQLLLGRLAKSGLTSVAPWSAAALLDIQVSDASRLLEELHNRHLLRREPSAAGTVRYSPDKELVSLLRRISPDRLGDSAGDRRWRLADGARDRRRRWSEAATRSAFDRLLVSCAWLAEQTAIRRAPYEWGFSEPELPHLPRPNIGLRTSEHPAAWFADERQQIQACMKLRHSTAPLAVEWRLQRALAAHCRAGRVYWADWREALDRGLELARRMRNGLARGICLLERAELAGNEARHDDAVRLAEQARAELASSNERWRARAARAVGVNLYRLGDRDTGEGELRAAAAVFERRGAKWWHARTRCNLGELNRFRGDFGQAYDLLTGARTEFEELGDADQAAKAGLLLGEVLGHMRRDLEAWLTLRDTLDAMDRAESPAWYRARCLRAIGRLDTSRIWFQYDDCDLVLSPDRDRDRAESLQDFVFRGSLGNYGDAARIHRLTADWHTWNRDRVRDSLGAKYTAECTAGWGREPRWAGERARRLRADQDEWTAEACIARVQEAYDLLAEAGDEWGRYRTLLILGELRMKADPDAGRREMEEAATGFARLGHTWWQARAWRHTADALFNVNLPAEAEEKARLAMEGYQQLSNLSGRLRTQLLLSWCLTKQGHHLAALGELEQVRVQAETGLAQGIVPVELVREVEDAYNHVIGEQFPMAGR